MMGITSIKDLMGGDALKQVRDKAIRAFKIP
jgi:hypothetical protein